MTRVRLSCGCVAKVTDRNARIAHELLCAWHNAPATVIVVIPAVPRREKLPDSAVPLF